MNAPVCRGLLMLALLGAGLPGQRAPTFAGEVAGIVFARCSQCHRPGQAAPFPLLTYRDVAKRQRQVLRVVSSRYMPPWLPVSGHGVFEGDRRLTGPEVDTIRRWVQAGAPEGDPDELPPRPTWARGWQLGEPDLVVELPEPFALPADGGDVFRNFVIPVPVGTTRFVQGFELQPGNPAVVHHAIVQLDSTGSCRDLDRRDAEPGFPGMAMGESEPPDGHFLGWTPGKVPREVSEGTAWRVSPGSDLVVQLHMTPSGKPEQVQPRIGLRFTEVAPTRSPYTIVLYTEDIDIPAGARDHVVRDRYVVPVDVHALGIYPHAHYLCTRMLGRARLPDGTTRSLFRIDDWDFNWQDEYRYAEPLALPAGTELSIEYHFDNSADNVRNPHQPPRRVTFGQSSTDEMATLSVQVLPDDPRDRPKLDRARWLHTLEKKPYDWHAHNQLATHLLREGDHGQAIEHLREALRLRPDYADALCNLGTALRSLGRLDDALAVYRRALELEPGDAVTHQSLGVALAMQRRIGPAEEHLRRALELRPTFAEAHLDLASLLALQGRTEAARALLGRALELRPDLPEAHNNIANTLLAEQRFEEATASYRRALALRPDYFNAHLNLGRALLALGEREAAARHLRTALDLRPGHPDARSLLEQAR